MKFNGLKNFVLNISCFHEAGNEMFLLLFTFLHFWLFNKILFFPYLTVHSLATQKVMRS